MTHDPAPSTEDLYRREQLERLVATANIHVRRKEYAEALTLLEQIIAADPRQHSIHRAIGDIHVARNRPREALDAYEQALECSPDNADYERCVATVKLKLGEAERTREYVQELADQPEAREASKKRVGCASASALIFPGFGQLYNGEYVKGGILAVLGMGGFLLMMWTALQAFLTAKESAFTETNFGAIGLAILAIVALVALIAYGVADAVRVARQQEKSDEVVEI